MFEDTQNRDPGNSGEEWKLGGPCTSGSEKRDECRTEKLWKVDKEVGIPWMESMKGEVRGVGIVDYIIERGYDKRV